MARIVLKIACGFPFLILTPGCLNPEPTLLIIFLYASLCDQVYQSEFTQGSRAHCGNQGVLGMRLSQRVGGTTEVKVWNESRDDQSGSLRP